jgi:hypothetical protein
MSHPARHEIEKFANDAFAIDRDRILTEYAEKKSRVLGQVKLTGNRGGYLPALVTWAAERERELALARADACVRAFTLFGEPSDAQAEEALKTDGRLSAARSISAIRGELQLRSVRLRIAEEGQGMPWHLEIERSLNTALKEGVLRLRQQRIMSKNSESPLRLGSPAGNRADGAKTVESAGAIGRNSLEVTEGPMADSDFWRRAEEKFRRLQPRPPQPGEVAHDSHNGLYAHWNPDGWSNSGDPWYLDNDSDAIRKLYSWAAESAAVELGHPGGPAALFFWLDLLRRDSPFFKPFGLGGHIYRLCDASAEYCLKCETNAKAAARGKTVGSRNKSTYQREVTGESNDQVGAGRSPLTERQRQTCDEAERELQDNLNAHEQMREVLEEPGWQQFGVRPNEITMAEEIAKLERDIKKYAITILGILAAASWPFDSTEHIRGRLQIDARNILKRALAKVDRRDVPMLDTNGLTKSLDLEVSKWVEKAEKELPPPSMARVPQASPDGGADMVAGTPNAATLEPPTAANGQRPDVKAATSVDSAMVEAVAERAARRQAVVNLILKRKRWKPGRLATKAGVGKNSVYEYLDGTRVKITDENRKAIAQTLELEPEQLPD